MKTVIMAGGRGTRISSVASDIPKPMIKIGNKPVLEHEIECLRQQGFTDLIITVSHLGNIIMDYFGDGSRFGVRIEYYFEEEPLGNAGALFKLKDKLTGDFLLLNADALFNVDFRRFVNWHYQHGGLATIMVHSNDHPYDSGLVVMDENGCVQRWLTKEDIRPKYYSNQVNAGLHVISSKLLEQNFSTVKVDLDRQILRPLAGTGNLFAYRSFEYAKEMGTPERYAAVCRDYADGVISNKSHLKKQKAVFLDRDGTINREVGHLSDINDFELLPGVAEAIRMINKAGYLAIVVTNQPVIARGELTVRGLSEIHNKMETLLGDGGAYLDAIYYCPHHPDKGFDGEVSELKIVCDCRKPKPGMLLQAQKDFNIDFKDSFMIGDSEKDMQVGMAVGCKCLQITAENNLLDLVKECICRE